MTKLTKSSIGVFKRLTKDRVDKAMSSYRNQKSDSHVYGRVVGVNADGSYQVQLNASSTTTRCVNCCTANIGDRVAVTIKANGKCDAIGRVGGDLFTISYGTADAPSTGTPNSIYIKVGG